jgi:hypothetical protein
MSNKNERKLRQFESEYHDTDDYVPWAMHGDEKLELMTNLREKYDAIAAVDKEGLDFLLNKAWSAGGDDARYEG